MNKSNHDEVLNAFVESHKILAKIMNYMYTPSVYVSSLDAPIHDHTMDLCGPACKLQEGKSKINEQK